MAYFSRGESARRRIKFEAIRQQAILLSSQLEWQIRRRLPAAVASVRKDGISNHVRYCLHIGLHDGDGAFRSVDLLPQVEVWS